MPARYPLWHYTDPEIAWAGSGRGTSSSSAGSPMGGRVPLRREQAGRSNGRTRTARQAAVRPRRPETDHSGEGIVATECRRADLGDPAWPSRWERLREDIVANDHPHPTLSESIGLAAEVYNPDCTDLPRNSIRPIQKDKRGGSQGTRVCGAPDMARRRAGSRGSESGTGTVRSRSSKRHPRWVRPEKRPPAHPAGRSHRPDLAGTTSTIAATPTAPCPHHVPDRRSRAYTGPRSPAVTAPARVPRAHSTDGGQHGIHPIWCWSRRRVEFQLARSREGRQG